MALFRFFLLFSACVLTVSAHYQFSVLTLNDNPTGPWMFVRKVNEYTATSFFDPVKDVHHPDFRCNNTLIQQPAQGTLPVRAGVDRLGFICTNIIYHPGVVSVFMAKAPGGNVSEWDGNGSHWFKVYELKPEYQGTPLGTMDWVVNIQKISFVLPKSLPVGEYLVRVENLALHIATTDGPEFYVSCAQIKVVEGGEGTPGPLVSIPGMYTGDEPQLYADVYAPLNEPLVLPGPTIWVG